MAPVLVDSYSESNRDGAENVADHYPGDNWSLTAQEAQSFYNADTAKNITSAKFYLMRTGSPTGNAHFVLYALSGAYGGGDDVPTGAVLATSGDLDTSTVDTSYTLYELTFTGAQQYEMQANTAYCIAYQAQTSGTLDGSNYIRVGYDGSSATHTGNGARDRHGNWAAQGTVDVCFYVYGEVVGAGGISVPVAMNHLNTHINKKVKGG